MQHLHSTECGRAVRTGAATLSAENVIPATEESMAPLNLSASMGDQTSQGDGTQRGSPGAAAEVREEDTAAIDLSMKKSPIITGLLKLTRSKKPKK